MLLIHARSNTRLTLKELREGRSSGEIESVSHLIRHQFVGLQQDFCFLNRSTIDPIHHTLVAYFLNQCRQMMWRDMEFASIERYRPLFLTVLMNESFEPNKKLFGTCQSSTLDGIVLRTLYLLNARDHSLQKVLHCFTAIRLKLDDIPEQVYQSKYPMHSLSEKSSVQSLLVLQCSHGILFQLSEHRQKFHLPQ